jgi:hypothetical protein
VQSVRGVTPLQVALQYAALLVSFRAGGVAFLARGVLAAVALSPLIPMTYDDLCDLKKVSIFLKNLLILLDFA